MSDFGAYLDSIDWAGGLIVGAAAVTLALVINWFLQSSVDESLTVVPWLRSRIGLAIRYRRGAPTATWICATCHSLNDPAADFCYRGCGAREDLALEVPADEATVQHVRRG